MIKNFRWFALLSATAAMTEAAIVVDHSANRTDWRISDLSTAGGSWGLAADDVTLDAPATIRHITWWGLYYNDIVPSSEAVRVRFYSPRPGDGLPGAVLFEQILPGPWRVTTGDVIPHVPPGTGLTAAEYRLDADLTTPISLDAYTPYWFEIAQDGAPEATFGWRGASAEQTGRAVTNPASGDWLQGTGFDMAFQLSTIPEPAMSCLSRKWSFPPRMIRFHLNGRKTHGKGPTELHWHGEAGYSAGAPDREGAHFRGV